MSLNRLYNKDKILDLNTPQYGQLFTDDDLSLLDAVDLTPYDPKLIENNLSELHLYSYNGDYLGSDNDVGYIVVDDISNSLLVNVREVFNISGIDRGSYKIVINFFKPLFGYKNTYPLFIKEISPDRTELKLELKPNFSTEDQTNFNYLRDTIEDLKSNDILNHVILNFGFNKITKIVNFKFERESEIVCYVKLYDELDIEINEKDTCWVGFEIMDPYTDNVSIIIPPVVEPINKLRGPNFDIDTDIFNSNSTIYKSWNDLLDSDTTTRSSIIDTFLSGSGIQLNIDYTDYANFIFYSSAVERIENFRYKKQLLEYYDEQIGTLNNASGSASIIHLNTNTDILRKRRDNVISSFSQFERWLYNEPTSSIFTHDISGSVTPWPKYIKNSKQYLHHSTSSLSIDWYTQNVASADLFDCDNYNKFTFAIPDHILRDPNNSEYVTFLDMMGEHFDELYSYVRALTSIFERDEHSQRGAPNELLPVIAESFGWKLQNTKQLSDLWLYAAGTNNSGSYEVPSGSLASLPHRNLNYQVWRRVVNNLPYLLKTKGTIRSVKSLLSIYGIPHTLISIKEFGGPSKNVNKPALIEDRYSYKLNFKNSDTFITFPRVFVSQSEAYWPGPPRQPDTVEFRFSTTYSGSSPMSLWGINDLVTGSAVNANLRLVHSQTLFGTGSYSGSVSYGFLEMGLRADNGNMYFGTTNELPLFDGDMWNVKISTTEYVNSSNTSSCLEVIVGKSADCTLGEITFTGSIVLNISDPYFRNWGATSSYDANSGVITFIGYSGSFNGGLHEYGYGEYPSNFSGSIQGYKEYFENLSLDTFYSHILNPGAYHGNEPSSSYYTLYRNFPMGVDSFRHDHTIVTSVTSSHPNRKNNFYQTASFYGFTGTQAQQYTGYREQQYIYTPTIGGNNIVSDKIRIEENKLINELSPESSAERGSFDFAPIDTNRLIIAFSPTDQVNRDIFNHMGPGELDDYIGDPGDLYKYEYPDLKRFSIEYWKKWARRFDINEFVRIFSVYDYTIFEQIKQLIPARADYIGGVLIEPHILERPKIINRRPSIENPQYEKDFSVLKLKYTGEINDLTSSISLKSDVDSEYSYLTSSFNLISSVDSDYCYFTSSLQLTASIDSEYNYYTSSIRLYDPYTGSKSVTQSIVDRYRNNKCYKEVVYHYSSSGNYLTEYKKNFATFVSMSYKWHYSRSLKETSYPFNECSSIDNNNRFAGSKLSGLDFNVDSLETVDGGPVVSFKEVSPNSLLVSSNNPGGLRVR